MKRPRIIALVYEGVSLSYRELNEKSNQLARHIRSQYKRKTSQEIEPDTLIALCLDRSLELIIGILGVLKAGGAYVPIDPSYPQERIDYILADTNAEIVLSQRQVVASGEARLAAGQVIYIDLSGDLYQTEARAN